MSTHTPAKTRRLIRNGTLVTMNSRREVLQGDILIENDLILKIGPSLKNESVDTVIDAQDCLVIPGLIQAHTHLCQALFRGDADDLALLDWLKKKIWPLESSHTPETLRLSAQIGLLEMQLAGTTAILDMGSVCHTDVLFESAQISGIRYFGGKCLMDLKKLSGPLYESTHTSLQEQDHLIRRWHKKTALLEYVLSPRFAVSCTDEILLACLDIQKKQKLLIHTHASENKDEIALIKKRTGLHNVDYFAKIGLLNRRTVLVHGVHLTPGELKKMAQAKTPLVHCPSSNLKLGSGIAPIEKYRKAKLTLALGADGAPCNNSMDPFIEMRLAALIQKPVFGPEALPARVAFEMATLGGAKALGKEKELGSLEIGKQADIVVVKRTHPSVVTVENVYSALVYSCLGRDVRDVLTAGREIVRDGQHLLLDQNRILPEARQAHQKLLKQI